MDERATGLILRTRFLTETSLIVHWLTLEFGRIATVAKGARRPKSPFRGKLDLFHKAPFTFQRSRKSDLHNLREVQLESTFPNLRKDLSQLRQASYAVALVEQTTERETPLETIYHLLESFLSHLNLTAFHELSLPSFEMKLLRELGLAPDLTSASIHAGTRALLQKVTACDWIQLTRLAPSPAQAKEIQRFLRAFMIYHLGRIPRQRHRDSEVGGVP